MEAGVIKLAMEFTDEIRRLKEEVRKLECALSFWKPLAEYRAAAAAANSSGSSNSSVDSDGSRQQRAVAAAATATAALEQIVNFLQDVD